MSSKQHEGFILAKNKDKLRWDNQICERASIDDIDPRAISKFVALVKDSKRLNITNDKKEAILKKLELLQGSKLTNAAMVLFGKKPSNFFSGAIVKCGRFKDETKTEFIDLKDFEGNLFENLDKSIAFIKEHLRLSAKIEGLYRKERWELPIEALREAIINALIHRDYFSTGFTYIKMYDSSIVIANPGKLPNSLKIKDLYKDHESHPKNPLLARVFYYTGLIDVWGRGINNIIELLKSEGIEKPRFEESGGYFRINFARSQPLVVDTTQDHPKDYP